MKETAKQLVERNATLLGVDMNNKAVSMTCRQILESSWRDSAKTLIDTWNSQAPAALKQPFNDAVIIEMWIIVHEGQIIAANSVERFLRSQGRAN